MKITVASGKGGTGKTTIATSLAVSLATADMTTHPPLFMDLDVEAPNGHLFLQPTVDTRQEVYMLIPHINQDMCNHCGTCADVCQYNAIAVVGNQTLVFAHLCHACGSCALMCPQCAIAEKPSLLGVLERGTAREGMHFAQGVLQTGESNPVPIIKNLKKWVEPARDQVVIIDASPGTSCPVVEAMHGSDVLLLVTEPTPFGLHDLQLAVQVAREIALPVGVIINRDGIGNDEVDTFCEKEGLPILLRVPFDRSLAEGIARGNTLVDIRPAFVESLHNLYYQAVELAATKTPHAHQYCVQEGGLA